MDFSSYICYTVHLSPNKNTWISSSQIMKLVIMQFYVVSATSKYSHQLPIHTTPSIQPLIQRDHISYP